MRVKPLLIILVLVTSAAPATATAAPRQSFSGTFTAERPGASTGYELAIDYTDYGRPGAKPYAVERVVQTLAAGARIDTRVPPRCGASDPQLMLVGSGACPTRTVVGGGELLTDSGAGAAPLLPRILRSRVTFFNAHPDLIFLTETTNTNGLPIRTASRTRVRGRTLTSTVPPVPGVPPPDPFLAIKRVRVALKPSAVGGRAFMTTPATCPPSGAWINSAAFTYRDRVTQTVRSRSACRHAGNARAPRGDRARPRIRIRGVPRRRCTSRSFRARVRIRDRSRLRRVRVTLDGRTIRRTTKKRFRVRVRARRLRSGRHRLTVRALDAAGNRGRRTVRFRRCR